MTIEATEKNIEWLIDRLYNCRRVLQLLNPQLGEFPTFVILTKCVDDRHRVENHFYHYFFAKYGLTNEKITPEVTHSGVSCFVLNEAHCRIVLMDV